MITFANKEAQSDGNIMSFAGFDQEIKEVITHLLEPESLFYISWQSVLPKFGTESPTLPSVEPRRWMSAI